MCPGIYSISDSEPWDATWLLQSEWSEGDVSRGLGQGLKKNSISESIWSTTHISQFLMEDQDQVCENPFPHRLKVTNLREIRLQTESDDIHTVQCLRLLDHLPCHLNCMPAGISSLTASVSLKVLGQFYKISQNWGSSISAKMIASRLEIGSIRPIDIEARSQSWPPFFSGMESNLGVFGFTRKVRVSTASFCDMSVFLTAQEKPRPPRRTSKLSRA